MRAVLLLLALTLGAVWPPTGPLSVTASSGTLSELASGDVATLPGVVRALAVPGGPDSGGSSDGGGTARRRSPFAMVEPRFGLPVRELVASAASADATEAAYQRHAARQALTRAGILSSPRTAPPACPV